MQEFHNVVRDLFSRVSPSGEDDEFISLMTIFNMQFGRPLEKLPRYASRDPHCCGNTSRVIMALAKLHLSLVSAREFTKIDEFERFMLSRPYGAFQISLTGNVLENQGHMFTIVKLNRNEYDVYQSYINRYNVLEFMYERDPHFKGKSEKEIVELMKKVRTIESVRGQWDRDTERCWKELAFFLRKEMYPFKEREGSVEFKASAFF